jgi:enterochelin esterase-like enzyme
VQVTGLSTSAQAGASADETTATFRVPDPEGRLAGVRLCQELRLPGGFRRSGTDWLLTVHRPPVDRMEYLLEFRYPDGHGETRTDPRNPRLAAGPFGLKSVLEFPGYAPPAWLTAPADPGVVFDCNRDGGEYRLWAPSDAGADEPLPLLVVNDGPEYDELSGLTRYLGAGIAGEWLPRLRAVLLRPQDRNQQYSASARYAAMLVKGILPALPATRLIGMGTSLGALAMLHAHCRYPGVFGGLFLQSGSFFFPAFDAQESRFPYYQRIVRFLAAAPPRGVIPVTLTCGIAEENIKNNRLMTWTLRDRGYTATLHEVPDVHNWTAWRDAFDPYLTQLLQRVC